MSARPVTGFTAVLPAAVLLAPVLPRPRTARPRTARPARDVAVRADGGIVAAGDAETCLVPARRLS
ncbi:hypothetical protein ACIP3A_00730 [Streptomyces tricolor]|uniref:hypothetical protein n=1 Tax=Streptomyces tricolor TaxID=68277 RepID=UPI0038266586